MMWLLTAISDSLKDDLGLELLRLKTGTPPRILAKSIDFSEMEVQDGEGDGQFSFWPKTEQDEMNTIDRGEIPQLPCYIVHTNAKTAKVIADNLHRSPMYNGSIQAVGTRYCPSIEDKINRFPDKDRHQVHLEPEGAFTDEYYINGISTSLPVDIQRQMIHSLPGLENAEITRYAYAVEYDVVAPHQTTNSLALRRWPNLFVAGQINGTSGYEEAAGQGLIAGCNATRYAQGKSPLVLGRDQAYIGVMVDDLVTKDISEPYRLFTSRAEYRLLLRQDNADRRLSKIAYEFGLLSEEKYKVVLEKENLIAEEKKRLEGIRVSGKTLWEQLRNNNTNYTEVVGEEHASEVELPAAVIEQLEIDARYETYIRREAAQVAKIKRLETWPIPETFDYMTVDGMRTEAQAKLNRFRPENLAQASRIDGVTPAEIGLLQVHIQRFTSTKGKKEAAEV